MSTIDIIAQVFGILGLIVIVSSFQFKDNKTFFMMQGAGSLFFFVNFFMIGAYAGAFFNLTNLVRGLLFMKDREKPWKTVLIEVLYTGCFLFSVFLTKGDYFQIFLSALPFVALLFMTVCMKKGNPTHIRVSQIIYMSPAWIVHNIFNFSLGGLICEIINMISSLIALIRYKKSDK